MAEILLQEDIRDVTGKQQPAAQCRVLEFMKIPFRTRPDGTPAVAKAALEQALGVQSSSETQNAVKLDLDAI